MNIAALKLNALKALFAGWLALQVMTAGAESTQPENMKLFLLIGQSNMAGRAPVEPQDKIPHPRVFTLAKDWSWVPAIDPIHYDKPDVPGVGLATTFGKVLAEADPKSVIGLIPCALGSSSLAEWEPGGQLYTIALARTREAMKHGKLAGILWHQGEADIQPERTATYVERFKAVMAQLRADLGANDVPLIVGELGRFRPENAPMNVMLAKLPAAVPLCAFVSAEGLVDKGDTLHFNAPSTREFGRRYAQAWFDLEKQKAAGSSRK